MTFTPGAGKLPRDQNSVPAMGAASLTDVNASATSVTILPLVIDDSTNRLLTTGIITVSALPTGAATSAKQDTGNTSLASIDAKLTNGLQLAQLVDPGGEAVTVTGGKLDVNATISGSGGGTSAVDDAAFTVASDTGTPIMGLADEVAPDSVNEGDVGVVRMSLNRNMYTVLRDAAGNERGANINASNQLSVSVDNTVTVNSHAVTNAGTFAVQPAGSVAHDGVGTGVNPLLNGGYASAAAPSDVSADGDAVRAWYLRNGAQVNVLSAAGALIGGDAANGLDVDVTRLPALVAGSAIIGNVRIDQTTPGTTNGVSIGYLGTTAVAVNSGNKDNGTQRVVIATDQPNLTTPLNTNVAQMNGVTVLMGNGASGTGAQRVTIADDSTGQVIARGPVAQDAPVSGNPVLNGARASTAIPSAMSADGDSVFLRSTRSGEQVTTPSATAANVGTSRYLNTALVATKQAANASAGNLYGYHIYNPNSTVMYVQFFNVASASVTVGSTTPDMVIAVPGLGWADASTSGPPIDFSTAMTIAATTTSTGSTAPGTGLLTNLWYK